MTVLGEAGVGKSRLLYELENELELASDVVFYFKARALATRQQVPYGVFRHLFATRFGIGESEDAASLAQKLESGFAPYLSSAEAQLVGHWLGFGLPPSDAVERLSGSAGFASACVVRLATYFRSLAGDSTVLLLIEDLHWADDDSLDLLARLLPMLVDSRLLVVGAARPTLMERRDDWLGDLSVATRLDLEPLTELDTWDLVREVLQRVEHVPAPLIELIVERTDGNPFFVEELVKMLVDDGVIVTDEERWWVELDRLDANRVPSTLTGVLEARLDALPARARAVLQRASVIGRVFWTEAVGALEPAGSAVETASGLEIACSCELLLRNDRSTLDAGTEMMFKHALLRDVAYGTVLLSERRRLHGRTAAWLADNAGERIDELGEVIAEHHRLAGELALAAVLLHRAGSRSLGDGAFDGGEAVARRRHRAVVGGIDRSAGGGMPRIGRVPVPDR